MLITSSYLFIHVNTFFLKVVDDCLFLSSTHLQELSLKIREPSLRLLLGPKSLLISHLLVVYIIIILRVKQILRVIRVYSHFIARIKLVALN